MQSYIPKGLPSFMVFTALLPPQLISVAVHSLVIFKAGIDKINVSEYNRVLNGINLYKNPGH